MPATYSWVVQGINHIHKETEREKEKIEGRREERRERERKGERQRERDKVITIGDSKWSEDSNSL